MSLLIIMFQKLSAVSGEVFLTLLTIFLTLLRRLIFLVRSFVPTWTISDSGFPSSTSSILSTMSPLVDPRIFKTSTYFDFDNPLLLTLCNFILHSLLFITYFHVVAIANLRFFFVVSIERDLIYWGVLGFSTSYFVK